MKTAAIIGGGPAGCSAALALLHYGYEVILFEQQKEWKGRVCGSFLNSEASRHLHTLGLLNEVRQAGASEVRQGWLTTSYGFQSKISLQQGNDVGLAIEREKLEKILISAVQKNGGKIIHNRVTGLQKTKRGATVTYRDTISRKFNVDLLIGADGRFSLGTYQKEHQSEGWYGWNAPFSGIVQRAGSLSLHFYRGGYVGLLTFANGVTNVSGLVYRSEKGEVSWQQFLNDALYNQKYLRTLLNRSIRIGPWKGVGPLPYTSQFRASQNLLPVGDAAAIGDPFLGEGIGRALAAGPMVVESLLRQKANPTQSVSDIYQSIWNKNYKKRLTFGTWARLAIKNKVLFPPVLGILVGSKKVAHEITQRFHQGYSQTLFQK